jgi:hypothetical protein
MPEYAQQEAAVSQAAMSFRLATVFPPIPYPELTQLERFAEVKKLCTKIAALKNIGFSGALIRCRSAP